MKIKINNSSDLIEFIKRPDVSLKDALDVTCSFYKVIAFFEGYESKEHLINSVEQLVKYWPDDRKERPIFLEGIMEPNEFSLKETHKNFLNNIPK